MAIEIRAPETGDFKDVQIIGPADYYAEVLVLGRRTIGIAPLRAMLETKPMRAGRNQGATDYKK